MLDLLLRAFRRRAALGLGPGVTPVTVFVPVGMLLGTSGFGIMSDETLGHLDVVVTIALTTLGVFIGAAAARERQERHDVFAAATIEAAITVTVVTLAVWTLSSTWDLPLEMSLPVTALALGICASASASPADDQWTIHLTPASARIADLDDVLPIVLGGIAIGLAAASSRPLWFSVGLPIGLGIGAAFCGWLLFERARNVAERGVFVLGTLALLGGGAAASGVSPLFAGMVAGAFWVIAPGRADHLIARDLKKVQHPLVVLLLIVAGAALRPSILAVWLLVPYVIFRVSGKIIGAWTASHVAPLVVPSQLASALIAPGVIGIGFALNLAQIAPAAAAPVVTAVSLGAVVSELLMIALAPPSPKK